MNGYHPGVFEGKEYSHDQVYQELMAVVASEGLECYSMETLNDIDVLDDMKGTSLMRLLDEPPEEEL
jgi:glycosyltransferase A (GT-A) superfamily protein (DUF2064 family)